MQPAAAFPVTRLRRNRDFHWKRRLVNETLLTVDNLIWPIFIRETSVAAEIPALPGIQRHSLETLLQPVEKAVKVGIPAIMLFPVIEPAKKTPRGEEAYNSENMINKAVRLIKSAFPELGIFCDVALDPYTSHGQDGLMENGVILNDESLESLGMQALSLAAAGVDVVAPSDMMDGRIGHIRKHLDKQGYKGTGILSYGAKYASNFYGPFRHAVQSSKNLGIMDKKTYQLSPANTDEALREVALDIQEGADMVMVKPGLAYLDILWRVRQSFKVPTYAYHVSGEYAMLKAASEKGWLSYEDSLLESLLSFRRAGANAIITYGAADAAEVLKTMGGIYNGA